MTTQTQQMTEGYNGSANITLGSIQLACGLLLCCLTGVQFGIASPLALISDGIWCGFIIILSGSFQIAAGKTRLKCWIVTVLVFSILAAIFVMPIIGIAVTEVIVVLFTEYGYDGDLDATLVVDGLRIFVAIVEGIIAIIASGMACRSTCCNPTQRTVVAQQVQFVGTNPQGQQIIVLSSAQTTAHQQAMAISMETQPGYSVSEKSVPDTSSTYSATPSAPETKTMSSLQFNN